MVAIHDGRISERSLERLNKAVGYSRKKLAPFRKFRAKALKEYTGIHWGAEDRKAKKVPNNLIELLVSILLHNLAANAPQVMITTIIPKLKRVSSLLESATNRSIDEIKLGQTLRAVVTDALFSIGIIRVGLNPIDEFQHEIEGNLIMPGQPFAERISPKHWVHDVLAPNYNKIDFAGHRYRLPLETVTSFEGFDNDVRQRAARMAFEQYDDDHEDGSHKRLGLDTEFVDHVDLWDLWLPKQKLTYTFLADDEGDDRAFDPDPLSVSEWSGPERGPYTLLGFNTVPDSIMPLSPVQIHMDLHMLANVIDRKLHDQVVSSKTVYPYRPNSNKEADLVRTLPDGSFLKMPDPTAVSALKMGGIDQQLFVFGQHTTDKFFINSGNLQTLGGLGISSDTARQDELLNASASQRLSDMQDMTIEAVTEIVKSLAWYLFYDPLIELPLTQRVKGTSLNRQVIFTAEDIEGDFLDYNFKIEPFSMQHRSPNSRLQTTERLLNIAMAAADQMAAQGVAIDWQKTLRMLAKDANNPEFADLLTFRNPEPPAQGQVGKPPIGVIDNSPAPSRPSGGGPTNSNLLSQKLAAASQPQPAGVG